PDVGSNADFFVEITLSWDTTTRSNLQLYVWDDPPVTDPPTPQRIIAQSSSERMPERVLLYRPDQKSYFIVVHNPAGTTPGNVPNPGGPNTGYRLKLEMTFRSYDSPFELLATQPPSTSPPTTTVTPGATPLGPSTITPTPFAIASLRPDPSFGDLAGRPSALDALPGAEGLSALPSAARPPPGPVNGFLLALWAGVVPAALVGGGALFLRRRAVASLDVD
ncbi:MAG: hypothetical protein L0221_19745, partial [Chloroflexi bacterium]|nr:hypothetical protein [Chloroflexota bacterium]